MTNWDDNLTAIENIRQVEESLQKETLKIQNIFPFFNLNDFYFAGGCIYSLWNNKPVKDFDIFCRNKNVVKKLKEYFAGNIDLVDFASKNAITCGNLQFVTKYVGDPVSEVQKFDFKHNCYWFDATGLHALYGWEHLNSACLTFNSRHTRDILNILTRIPKFVERGMKISQLEIAEIIEAGTKFPAVLFERRSIKNLGRNMGDWY